MKTGKTISEVFDESKIPDCDKEKYLGFLKSHLQADNAEINTPWFVKIITIFGAWFSMLFFLLFILLMIEPLHSETAIIILGVVFIAAGIAVSYANRKNHFLDPLSLSMSMLGQVLFFAGIFMKTENKTVWSWSLVVELLIYFLAKSYTQKFLSVILIPVCIIGIIWSNSAFEMTHLLIGGLSAFSVLIWINEISLQIWLKKYPYFFISTAYGIVSGLLITLILSISNIPYIIINNWPVSSLFLFLSLSYLLYESLCQSLGVKKKTFGIIITVLAILFAPIIHSPGIIASVLVILLGFTKNNRVMLVLGTVFLAIFMVSFYYFLQQTLLTKSLNLIVTGGLFLIIGYCLSLLKKREII